MAMKRSPCSPERSHWGSNERGPPVDSSASVYSMVRARGLNVFAGVLTGERVMLLGFRMVHA